MGLQTTFHAPRGADFLGWRVSRGGITEIVHEDGSAHRQVWRLAQGFAEESLVEALSLAVAAPRVVPRLLEELKKRAIAVESISA
jgi:hypothetical protein